MNESELHFFKKFAEEMFPGYENCPVIFAEAKVAWANSGLLNSETEIITRWENECN